MFTLTINTDNAAFEYDAAEAVNELLRKVIREMGAGHTDRAIMDANGNRVGEWELSDRPDSAAKGATPARCTARNSACVRAYGHDGRHMLESAR